MLGKLLDRFCFNTIFLFIAVVVILGGKLFSPKNETPDMKKGREDMRGEDWPLSPPPLCVEAADKVYGLGTSDWNNIKVEHFGWAEGLLLG